MGDGERAGVEIARVDASGVPVFWSKVPGESQAAIMFRVGRVDEAPAQAGLTHLVEHLALYPLGRPAYAMNGFMDDTRTVFYATGTQAEVEGFLASVCDHLQALPLDRLEAERQVLLTEGFARSSVVAPHMRLRFGATGFANGYFGELGLHSLTAEEVARWSAERFTSQNAAAWVSFEPSEELELRLPEGRRFRVPEPLPLPSVELPAFVSEGSSGVALSWLGERSTTLNVATGVAGITAEDRLRRQRGLSYTVAPSYAQLDTSIAHCSLYADTMPAAAGVVRETILAVVDEIAAGGAERRYLEEQVSRAVRSERDLTHLPASLDAAAMNELTGARQWTPQELIGEMQELEPQSLAEAMAPALDTLLLTVPSGVGVDRARFHLYGEGVVHERVEGESFHRPPAVKRLRGAREELVIGERGVSFVQPDGDIVTVLYEDCVAVADEGDGLRLCAADGSWGFIRFVGPGERERFSELLKRYLPGELWVVTDRTYLVRLKVAERGVLRRGLAASDESPRPLANLAKLLLDGEPVLDTAIVRFADSEVKWLFAVTDRRVAWLVGDASETRVAPLASIDGVETAGRLRKSKVRFRIGSDPIELTVLGGASATELVASLREASEQSALGPAPPPPGLPGAPA